MLFHLARVEKAGGAGFGSVARREIDFRQRERHGCVERRFLYMLVEGSGEFRIVEREVVSFDESEDIRWKPTSKSARLTDD